MSIFKVLVALVKTLVVPRAALAAENLAFRHHRPVRASPWQNPFCERLIGSIRRECIDHVIILSEEDLRRVVSEYLRYYHDDGCHLSLDRNAPNERAVERRGTGQVISESRVGGLHRRHRRVA